MKNIIAIFAAAAVGCAAAYFYVAHLKDQQFKKEREEWNAQRQDDQDRLEKELQTARNRATTAGQIETRIETPAAIKATPGDLLDHLLKQKPPADDNRYKVIRKIIHELETLADLGPEALPEIRALLAKKIDVSYERKRDETDNRGTDGGLAGGERGSTSPAQLPRTEFYYPYSLRLGLFDVLKQIGGDEAQQILVEALTSTGRGVEVATLARLLDEMAPGKFRDAAINAAKALLTHPTSAPDPTRLDESSRAYLYSVLATFSDPSFVPQAQSQLVGADGRLDRTALGYLTATLKDRVLPVLHHAYKDTRLTNSYEKATVLSAAFPFVGTHPQADEMFLDAVLHAPPAGGRDGFLPYMAVGRMDNGDLTRPQILGRLQVLATLKASVKEERLAGMIDRTAQNLQNKLNPGPNKARNSGGDRRRGGSTP